MGCEKRVAEEREKVRGKGRGQKEGGGERGTEEKGSFGDMQFRFKRVQNQKAHKESNEGL